MLGFNDSSAILGFGIACGFAALIISILGIPVIFKAAFSGELQIYSTLTEEFKNVSRRDKVYYLIFAVRRFLYSVVLVFLDS